MFKDQITIRMAEKKLSIRKLSAESGVRYATISDWLNGKKDIYVRNLEKLLEALK